MIDSNIRAAAVVESKKTAAASCRCRHYYLDLVVGMRQLGSAFEIEVHQPEKRLQPEIVAAVVIDAAADVESFVASQLMTLRVVVVDDVVVVACPAFAAAAAAVVVAVGAIETVEWQLAHLVVASLVCPGFPIEYLDPHFDF